MSNGGLVDRGWNLATAALDQGGGHGGLVRRTGISLESCEHPFYSEPADLLRVLRHHCDGGFDQIGEWEIVETDEGNGMLRVRFSEGVKCADGDQVLGTDHSRRRVIRLEKSAKRRLCVGRVMELGDHRRRCRRYARASQRFEEALLACECCLDAQTIGQ